MMQVTKQHKMPLNHHDGLPFPTNREVELAALSAHSQLLMQCIPICNVGRMPVQVRCLAQGQNSELSRHVTYVWVCHKKNILNIKKNEYNLGFLLGYAGRFRRKLKANEPFLLPDQE